MIDDQIDYTLTGETPPPATEVAATEPVVEMTVEEKARAQGWRPQEEYRGNKEEWVDADEFVKRGSFFRKIESQNKQINELKSIINNMSSTLTKAEERAYKKALSELEAKREEARRNRDINTYDRVLKEEESLKSQYAVTIEPSPAPSANSLEVEIAEIKQQDYYKRFEAVNPWVNKTDPLSVAKQAYATQLAKDLESKKGGVTNEEIFQYVSEQVAKQFDSNFTGKPATVSSSNLGRSSSRVEDSSNLNEAEKLVLNYLKRNGRPQEEINSYLKQIKESKK
jgi:hypothetical protein